MQLITLTGTFFCGMLTLLAQNVPDTITGPNNSAVKALCLLQGPKDQHIETYVTPSTEAIACNCLYLLRKFAQ